MIVEHREFNDAEDLSHALRHARVSAMQLGRGAYQGELTRYTVGGWSVQHLSFNAGLATCRGSGPADRHAILLPLRLSDRFRLLGDEVTTSSLGVYAPGSEHADTTSAGVREVVLVPPPEVVEACTRDITVAMPRSGSHHRRAHADRLSACRAALEELHGLAMRTPDLLAGPALAACLADRLARLVHDALASVEVHAPRGRPPMPRRAVLRHLSERLAQTDAPIYTIEICAELGLSFPTLRRIFIDWYGLPPAQYLLIRRYYLARRRLRSRAYPTVAEAALSCGFLDPGRFSTRYQQIFGELPSATLRRASGVATK